MTTFISIDAETNGLSGRAFAVALTLNDEASELDGVVFRCPVGELQVDPWVAENVLPAIADVPENLAEYPYLLAEVKQTIKRWGGRKVPLIAHVAWPVEARLLLDVYPGEWIWEGPYPLIDVASMLLARGFDPLTVDGFLRDVGAEPPSGSPHHPLYDARAAAMCYRALLASLNPT